MLEKYLEEIGLSDKEATIYIALLQFENATPAQIATKTGLNRATTYVVLETLEKKGLVSEIDLGKKIHYRAAPPERLETYVEQQQLRLEETAKRLKDIIPQIKSVQREAGERPIVKFYDGKEAALAGNLAFFDSISTEGVGYFLLNRDLVEEVFSPKELEYVAKIRPKKAIKGKTLYSSDKTVLNTNELTERKKVDAAKYPLYCDISMYEDRIQIVTLGKSVSSIFIQSRDVAETLKSLFKMAFDNTNGI